MLTKENIDKYFEGINESLKSVGKHGELIMAGGASLTTIYNAREATKDIDAIFEPTKELREIIKSMADEHGLEEDWLNDGVKGFFNNKLKVETYKEYSNLTVKSIDAEGLLAMKLTSARHGSRDLADSLTLMKHIDIKEIDELYEIVEKYTHKNQQTPNSYYFTQSAFEKYQEEKEQNKEVNQVNPEENKRRREAFMLQQGRE